MSAPESAAHLFSLTGRTAIITGGTAGLGFDMAAALAGAGSDIILTSRDIAKAQSSAESLRQTFGVQVLVAELDQRDPGSVEAFARQAREWKGRIDILINNAGGGSGASEGNLFDRDPADIASMITTNLTGVIYCCREIGRAMSAQGHGKIINIASIAGMVGRDRELYRSTGVKEQPVDYAAAKAGVLGLTRDLAAFLAPFNIQVNAISPGGFDKGMLPPAFMAGYSALNMQSRMGKIGTDIKGAALFLASAASDHITGQNLVIDGGFTVMK